MHPQSESRGSLGVRGDSFAKLGDDECAKALEFLDLDAETTTPAPFKLSRLGCEHLFQRNLRSLEAICIRELVFAVTLIDCNNPEGDGNRRKDRTACPPLLYDMLLSGGGDKSTGARLFPPTPASLTRAVLADIQPLSLTHPVLAPLQSGSRLAAASSAHAFVTLAISRLCQRRFLSTAFAYQWAECLRKVTATLTDLTTRYDSILSGLLETSSSSSSSSSSRCREEKVQTAESKMGALIGLVLRSSLLQMAAPEHLLLRILLAAAWGACRLRLRPDQESDVDYGVDDEELDGPMQAAAEAIKSVCGYAWATMPATLEEAVVTDPTSGAMHKKLYLLCCCYHLQLAVQLLDMAATNKLTEVVRMRGSIRGRLGSRDSGDEDEEEGQEKAGTREEADEDDEQQSLLLAMCRTLHLLAVPRAPVLSPVPEMASTVRCGLAMACSGGPWGRFDFLNSLLRNPMQLDKGTPGKGSGGGGSLAMVPWRCASQQRMLDEMRRDAGYAHFHALSRSDAVGVLLDYAAVAPSSCAGSFVVRPHDRHPELLFLSFHTVNPSKDKAGAAAGDKDLGSLVTHAIIRRVPVDSRDRRRQVSDLKRSLDEEEEPAKERFEYKCGKVGPFYSLAEMLQAISKVLSPSSKSAGGLAMTSPVPLPPFNRLSLPTYKGSGPAAAAAALFGLASCDPSARLWDDVAKSGIVATDPEPRVDPSCLQPDAASAVPCAPLDPWHCPVTSSSSSSGGVASRAIIVHGVICLLVAENLLATGTREGQCGDRLSALCHCLSRSLGYLLAPAPDPTISFLPLFAPSGMLMAERIAGHLFDSCSVQTVKLPGKGSGLGTTEYRAECLDPTEVISWLVEKEERLQVWMKEGSREGGDAFPGAGSGSARSLGQSLQAILMLKQAVLESHALSPPKSTSSSCSSSSSSSSSSSLLPPAEPENYTAEDWAIAYASWLQEARVLYATIKPPDMAFQASTTFYRYRDPWEVRVVSEAKALGGESAMPAPGERFRLGRFFYFRPVSSSALSTLAVGLEVLSGGGALRDVWDSLRGESWVASYIGSRDVATAAVRTVRPSTVVLSPCPAPVQSLSPLHASLELHLYRNSLFARMGLVHRFIGSLQVTLLGIKEVATVGGALGAASLLNFAPPSSMEVFMAVCLMRGGGDNARTGGGGSSAWDSSSSKQKDASGRVPADGTYTGQPRRADIYKAPLSGMGSGNSNIGNGNGMGVGMTRRGGVGGGGGVEYKVRDRTLLRFPLPEAVSKVGDAGTGASGATCSRGRGYRQRAEEETWRGAMHAPPNTLHVTVFEKTFLSENKLGELHLPLSFLSPDETADEWHPLMNERRGGGAWLVRLQLHLSFPSVCLEAAPPLRNSQKEVGSNDVANAERARKGQGDRAVAREIF